MEKSKSGSNKPPKEANAFPNKANGSMDYLSKQSKFASKDAAKLKRGAFKENRYD